MDYVVTHCAPTSIQKELLRARSTPDALTDFLEEVRQRCQFRYWFSGITMMTESSGSDLSCCMRR